jgi:hypothetical protein
MGSGRNRRNRVESLHGFWPGIESSLGLCESSAQLLNAFYGIWNDVGVFPEEIDQSIWLAGKHTQSSSTHTAGSTTQQTHTNTLTGGVSTFYPLRPELIESTYHHYRACAQDRTWLNAGEQFLQSLEQHAKTDCGYASILNAHTSTHTYIANTHTHIYISPTHTSGGGGGGTHSAHTQNSVSLSDDMPSFFLSETCKYLYLLFDEHNFIHAHNRSYVFSTEAHPFDSMQMPSSSEETHTDTHTSVNKHSADKHTGKHTDKPSKKPQSASKHSTTPANKRPNTNSKKPTPPSESTEQTSASSSATAVHTHILQDKYMGKRCQHRLWWDASASFDNEYVLPSSKRIVHTQQSHTADTDTHRDKSTSGKHTHGKSHTHTVIIDQSTLNAVKDEKYSVQAIASQSMNKVESLLNEVYEHMFVDTHTASTDPTTAAQPAPTHTPSTPTPTNTHKAAMVFRQELVGGFADNKHKKQRMCLKNEQPHTHTPQQAHLDNAAGGKTEQVQTVEVIHLRFCICICICNICGV